MNDLEKAFCRLFPESAATFLIETKKEKRRSNRFNKKYQSLPDDARLYLDFQTLSGQPYGEPVYMFDGVCIFSNGEMHSGW